MVYGKMKCSGGVQETLPEEKNRRKYVCLHHITLHKREILQKLS